MILNNLIEFLDYRFYTAHEQEGATQKFFAALPHQETQVPLEFFQN